MRFFKVTYGKKDDIEDPSVSNNSNTKEELLKLWETSAQMANSVSERRDKTNNWFITLHIAIFGLLVSCPFERIKYVSILGIILAVVWIILLSNYRKLNSAKFKVICEIEEQFSIKPFSEEWNFLKEDACYTGFTKIEFLLPVIAIILYIILIHFKL